jgi:hypothetical protein
MTAVISREQARRTCLTAAAGVLMLAAAFVMMVAAAPAHGGARAHAAGAHAAGAYGAMQLATDACHQVTPRSDSVTARACLAGPSAVSARADAYVPSVMSDSWSAGSSARVAGPPLARAAAS